MEEKIIYSVTQKQVDESIVAEQFFKLGNKTTVCLLILNTGFEVIGSSAPVDPENFDFSIGKGLAREKALDQVWGHLGSIVQWQKAVNDQNEMRRKEAEENQSFNPKTLKDSLKKVEAEPVEEIEVEAEEITDLEDTQAPVQ